MRSRESRAYLMFYAYCGMDIILNQTPFREDLVILRQTAARYIRRARRYHQQVTTLKRGLKWEFETPDDAMMVSDNDGVMWLIVPDRMEYDDDSEATSDDD